MAPGHGLSLTNGFHTRSGHSMTGGPLRVENEVFHFVHDEVASSTELGPPRLGATAQLSLHSAEPLATAANTTGLLRDDAAAAPRQALPRAPPVSSADHQAVPLASDRYAAPEVQGEAGPTIDVGPVPAELLLLTAQVYAA